MAKRQIIVPNWLKEQAGLIEKGHEVKVTVRELLMQFDREKRTSNAVSKIRKALRKQGLITTPKFFSVNIGAQIQIKKSTKRTPKEEELKDDARQPIITFGMLKCVEQQKLLREIRKDKAGQPIPNTYPKWTVKPSEPIAAAVTILSQQDVDFVPVGDTENNIVKVVSWDEVAMMDLFKRDRSKTPCGEVDAAPVFVTESDSVYDKKLEIKKFGYVIVRKDIEDDESGRAFAIVRAADLANELLMLTESFLMLQEIENIVRAILEETEPTQEDIDNALKATDRGKQKTLDQLTFANYMSIFTTEHFVNKFKKIGLPEAMTNQVYLKLASIRDIRNKVVHFHPDENSEFAKEELSKARDSLRKILEKLQSRP